MTGWELLHRTRTEPLNSGVNYRLRSGDVFNGEAGANRPNLYHGHRPTEILLLLVLSKTELVVEFA